MGLTQRGMRLRCATAASGIPFEPDSGAGRMRKAGLAASTVGLKIGLK